MGLFDCLIVCLWDLLLLIVVACLFMGLSLLLPLSLSSPTNKSINSLTLGVVVGVDEERVEDVVVVGLPAPVAPSVRLLCERW